MDALPKLSESVQRCDVTVRIFETGMLLYSLGSISTDTTIKYLGCIRV